MAAAAADKDAFSYCSNRSVPGAPFLRINRPWHPTLAWGLSARLILIGTMRLSLRKIHRYRGRISMVKKNVESNPFHSAQCDRDCHGVRR